MAGHVSEIAGFGCRLCGGAELSLYYTLGNAGQFRYFRCADCGLVNYDLSGGLDQRQYTQIFVDPRDDRHKRNRDGDATFGFIARHLPQPGRMIDIGCGNGRLLWQAQQAGWQVKGLELSGEMARFAAEAVGCVVEASDFLTSEASAADRAAYDLVVLRHVLEHLPQPLVAMEKIAALARPGGHLLLEMPNVEGWSKHWVRLITRMGLHRRHFAADLVPGHACEYSQRSCAALLDRTGFKLRRWETYSKKPFANWLLARFPVGTKARALARKQ